MSGYVYAALASDGILKVGQSHTPQSRLRAHASAARKRGAVLTGEWAWAQEAPASAEAELIQAAHRTGQAAWGKEWFKDVDIERFLECANNLVSKASPCDRSMSGHGRTFTRDGQDYWKWLAKAHPNRSHYARHFGPAAQLGMSVDEYVGLYVSADLEFCRHSDSGFRCMRAQEHEGDHHMETRYRWRSP